MINMPEKPRLWPIVSILIHSALQELQSTYGQCIACSANTVVEHSDNLRQHSMPPKAFAAAPWLSVSTSVVCRYEDAASHLCAAADAGDMRQLTRLIDNGVDPNVRDYDQRTAFHIAARKGCLKVVDYLVACKAEINAVDR